MTWSGPVLLYVAEDRTQARLDGLWETLTEGQGECLEAVAMDIMERAVERDMAAPL
jgi:hypothetical protein